MKGLQATFFSWKTFFFLRRIPNWLNITDWSLFTNHDVDKHCKAIPIPTTVVSSFMYRCVWFFFFFQIIHTHTQISTAPSFLFRNKYQINTQGLFTYLWLVNQIISEAFRINLSFAIPQIKILSYVPSIGVNGENHGIRYPNIKPWIIGNFTIFF